MFKNSIVFCRGRPPQQLLNSRPLHPAAAGSAVYSTTAHRSNPTAGDDPDLSWPTTPFITPYDIFKQKRNQPYSKGRFYDLVKIYHPDRPCNGHPLCRDISPEVRLHRYRLVVAANEILSDPTRRRVYDQFGAGWDYRTGSSQNDMAARWYRHGPIYANATWEDWEKYYHSSNDQGKQQVDRRTFTTLLILLGLFGGVAQLAMITRQRTGYEQRIRDVNKRSARFLTGRRDDSRSPSNEVRVRKFLMHRDPSGSGLKEEEQHVYRDFLGKDSGSSSVKDNRSPAKVIDPAKAG